MTTLSAREIIKKEYGDSKNFMTQWVLGHYKTRRNQAAELSTGIGLFDTRIWGVSVVTLHEDGSTTRETDLSSCFESEQEARDYIESLKNH